ncbi:MAG TPA: alpha/beta fold hydrolase [Solirubrobacteraceae bacterium]|nr:alpha/beta fold hydrolase [Solirubrobacteraceae bacterium]
MQLSFERRGPSDVTPGSELVLIHGIGSRWQMWEPVLDRLAAERAVIALDLPGFGHSAAAPPGRLPGAPGLAALVAEFLEGLGIRRAHVAGNSLGGLVALRMGAAGRASSVTALSPAGFASSAESLWSTTSLRVDRWLARRIRPHADRLSERAWFRRLAYWQMVGPEARTTPLDVADAIRSLADAPGFEENLRAAGRERFWLPRPLHIPVTIAWGDHDHLLLPRQAARAAVRVPGARIVPLPGCGHIPTYDNPELVARVLLEGCSPRA